MNYDTDAILCRQDVFSSLEIPDGGPRQVLGIAVPGPVRAAGHTPAHADIQAVITFGLLRFRHFHDHSESQQMWRIDDIDEITPWNVAFSERKKNEAQNMIFSKYVTNVT